VWSIGADDLVAGGYGGPAAEQSPLTFVVTFGGFHAPCETTSVVRVQVDPPLL
jgi:hypothetical protein